MTDHIDEERVAFHEAAHATMSYLLHVRVGAVSIVPGRGYHGVAFSGPVGMPKVVNAADLDTSLVQMPARLRKALEKRILISLAGYLGEKLMPSRPAFSVGELEDNETAERLALIAAPNPREAELLANHVGGDGDASRCESLAFAAAGSGLSTRFLWLLEGVAEQQFVLTERFQTLLRALVAALMKHKELSGAAVKMILVEADRT